MRPDLIGVIAYRDLPDGRTLYVYPLFFGARLCIGKTGDTGYAHAF